MLDGTPIDALKGGRTHEIGERLDREGKKRKYTTLYDQHVLWAGDHVRISLRAGGPDHVKSAIKNVGSRSSRPGKFTL